MRIHTLFGISNSHKKQGVFLVLAVALLLGPSPASGSIIGPGQITVTNGDQAFNLIAVDLNNPATFGPGQYSASAFSFGFTDFLGYQTKGDITPVVLTGSGTNFTPIAIGDPISYLGATSFASKPFGGTSMFTLVTSKTLYGGLYWSATFNGGAELRMPVGFANNVGSTFVVYGGGTGPGADPPVIDTLIRGSSNGFFERTYDFSIDVVPVAAVVPEPSSLLLALTGISLLGSGCLCRKWLTCSANPA